MNRIPLARSRAELTVDDDADPVDLEQRLLDADFRSTCGHLLPPQPIAELAEHVRATGRPDLIARADLLLAGTLIRQGRLDDAVTAIRAIIAWAAPAGDADVLGTGHRLLASVFRAIGDNAEMLAQAAEALAAHGEGGVWWRRARILCVLAVALDLNGSWTEAQARYEAALALAAPSAQLSLLIVNNLADGHYERGHTVAAEACAARMLELANREDVTVTALNHDTLACVAMMRGDHDAATAHLAHVLDADEAARTAILSEPDSLGACLLRLAEIRRRAGDYRGAVQALNRCDEEVARRGVTWVGNAALLERAELAAARGRFRKAYVCHKRYHEAYRLFQDDRREARARVILALYANREALLARDQFRELANRDPLTGLHNRRHCDEALAALTSSAATPLSTALIDIDFFKRINDECSHETGDEVLRELAAILLAECPPPAEVARLGGEEFLLVFPDTDATQAWLRCEQVRRAIADHDWRPLTAGRPITVSIGVTTAGGRTTAAKLLADADRNLYAAKRTGRNRVVED